MQQHVKGPEPQGQRGCRPRAHRGEMGGLSRASEGSLFQMPCGRCVENRRGQD